MLLKKNDENKGYYKKKMNKVFLCRSHVLELFYQAAIFDSILGKKNAFNLSLP